MRFFPFCLCLLSVTTVARADWPAFRGPHGNGHAAQSKPLGLPLEWSETKNVAWKTPIPHRGWSTPVTQGNQIWLTTATPKGNDFFALCVDAGTGKVVFHERLFHCDDPEPLGNRTNCYASPSPAIEPGRVYTSFGSYGTACLDTGTKKVLWRRTDLKCRHYRGPGSSPILYDKLLILTMDGVDRQYLAALDKTTGKTVWEADRTTKWDDIGRDGKPFREGDFRKGFATPLVMETKGGPQLVSPGSMCAYAYDPRTGKELWKTPHRSHTSVLCPVYAEGLAVFCTGLGGPQLWAVRPDGRGDVGKTHVAWRVSADTPRTPSPIVVDGLIYMISDTGVTTCLEAKTGQRVWRSRLGGSYASSPIYADGRLYFCSQQGKTTVVKPGRTCEVLATNNLDGGFMASPAISGGALVLRTKTHLYRIEDGGA